MSNNNSKISPVTDFELLAKMFFYLNNLCSYLSLPRLQHHCIGAMASIFELLYYLQEHNLKDYGNNS